MHCTKQEIAIVYGCTIDDLLVWNPDVDDNLSVGEILYIWVDEKSYQRIQENSNDSLNVKENHQ